MTEFTSEDAIKLSAMTERLERLLFYIDWEIDRMKYHSRPILLEDFEVVRDEIDKILKQHDKAANEEDGREEVNYRGNE